MTSERLPAMILCADVLPDGSWRQLLEWLPCRVIVVSRLADDRLWTETLDLGACDLLPDPFGETELDRALDSAALSGCEPAAAVRHPMWLAASG